MQEGREMGWYTFLVFVHVLATFLFFWVFPSIRSVQRSCFISMGKLQLQPWKLIPAAFVRWFLGLPGCRDRHFVSFASIPGLVGFSRVFLWVSWVFLWVSRVFLLLLI